MTSFIIQMRIWRPREVICPQVTQQRQRVGHTDPESTLWDYLAWQGCTMLKHKEGLVWGPWGLQMTVLALWDIWSFRFSGKSNAQIWDIPATSGTRKEVIWLLACQEVASLFSPKGKVLSPHAADEWALRWMTNSQTSQSQNFVFILLKMPWVSELNTLIYPAKYAYMFLIKKKKTSEISFFGSLLSDT